MKRKIVGAVLLTAAVLTGCTSVPNLSDVHRDMEAEYMAGVLLKYDANNGDMLDYDRSILTPTQPPVPTDPPKASKAPADSSAKPASGGKDQGTETPEYVDVSQVLSGKDISIKLQRYELKKSYGSSDAMLSASGKHSLLIVKFQVKNTSGSAKKANMMSKDLKYTLQVDGTTLGTPQMTILENDLQFFNQKIAAGRSKEAVLIFEVKDSAKLQNAAVNVSDGTKTAQLPLQ